MSKPSIFSKNYAKEVKRRRMKIFLWIIVPIVGLTIFLITDFNELFDKGISMNKGINSILLNKSKEDKKEEAAKEQKKVEEVKPKPLAEKPKAPQEKVVAENKTFLLSLSDGQKISVEYNVKGTEKIINGISDSKNISYDISPSKKAIVIQSKINQDLLYFDVMETSKDVTKKKHTSSKGQAYLKENKLNKTPNYLWSVNPKFIDEENIAYISELPWMNGKAVQYIWKINLTNNAHTQVKPASGKNISFKTITPKGLETIIDGNIVYVTSEGKVIK